jgi:excisionase family DNA binding protein
VIAMKKTDASALLDKFRRAHRNNTGAQFSNQELWTLAELGLLHILAKAEADEILASRHPVDETKTDAAAPKVYSVRTLADRWECSEGLVRNLIVRGELRSFRNGNLIRIKAAAVAEVEAKRG